MAYGLFHHGHRIGGTFDTCDDVAQFALHLGHYDDVPIGDDDSGPIRHVLRQGYSIEECPTEPAKARLITP